MSGAALVTIPRALQAPVSNIVQLRVSGNSVYAQLVELLLKSPAVILFLLVAKLGTQQLWVHENQLPPGF